MVAEADDLRFFYAEALGPCEILAAVGSGAAVKTGAPLLPGRYLVQFHTVAGATLVWCRQGAHEGVEAVAAAPATPFDVSQDPRPTFVCMVRPSGKGGGAESQTDGLSFVTDAGTVTVAITRVSRMRG